MSWRCLELDYQDARYLLFFHVLLVDELTLTFVQFFQVGSGEKSRKLAMNKKKKLGDRQIPKNGGIFGRYTMVYPENPTNSFEDRWYRCAFV